MPNDKPANSGPKRVLGRGLADLLPVGGGAAEPTPTPASPAEELPVALLKPNPNQPRTRFDETALEELAESIRVNGVLQPLLVRPRGSGTYEIVAGERRYRAALRAGLTRVPAVIRDLSDDDTLALALIENLIREDIGPLEAARAYRRLMDEFGWTQEEMGRRVSKSRPAIANTLRLLELPEEIQNGLDEGKLTEGHARALLGDRRHREASGFAQRQIDTYRDTVRKGLTVREVERRMSMSEPDNSPATSTLRTANPDWTALEDRLRSSLGTRIRLSGTAERGKLEVEFFSMEEFEGLLARLERIAGGG